MFFFQVAVILVLCLGLVVDDVTSKSSVRRRSAVPAEAVQLRSDGDLALVNRIPRARKQRSALMEKLGRGYGYGGYGYGGYGRGYGGYGGYGRYYGR